MQDPTGKRWTKGSLGHLFATKHIVLQEHKNFKTGREEAVAAAAERLMTPRVWAPRLDKRKA